jgi:hypothetical protein
MVIPELVPGTRSAYLLSMIHRIAFLLPLSFGFLTLAACTGQIVGNDTNSGGRCEAAPACAPEEEQIAFWDTLSGSQPSIACPTGSTCRTQEICGYAVACASRVANCEAIPVCDRGDSKVDLASGCAKGQSCYERELCGSKILCAKTACSNTRCDSGDREIGEIPTCKPNQPCPPVAQPVCPEGNRCYTRDLCGNSTLYCASPAVVDCAALPVCRGNDRQLPLAECTAMNALPALYTETACGMTICCSP